MEQQISAVMLPKPFRLAVAQLFGPELTGKIEQRLGELAVACNRSVKCKRPERCQKATLCQMPTNRQLQWHLREYILPGLAVYQVLRAEGQSQEAALAKVDELIALVVVPQYHQMTWLGRFPWIYPLLRLVIRPAMRQYPAGGWQIDWLENSRDAIRFNMRSCFYFDTLSRYGAPELTASFCRGDDLVYSQISPYLEWNRTQTIGRGAEYCDFCFARAGKGKKEGRQ
jgi:hypothetical protein